MKKVYVKTNSGTINVQEIDEAWYQEEDDGEDDDVWWSSDRRIVPEKKYTNEELRSFVIDALTELEANGVIDLLLLKNDSLRDYWSTHKAKLARIEAEKREKQRIESIRVEALARLTEEEKMVLGLIPKSKKSSTKLVRNDWSS